MTLFSYHKYNDFILIQEIYTQKYTACTKDEANMNNDCMSHEQLVTSRGFTITYNNQCGRSISGSVSGIGYTQNGEEQVNSASFTIPAGSGTKSGSVYFSREVVCGDVTISGHDSGNC
jgi:hypothetical protein